MTRFLCLCAVFVAMSLARADDEGSLTLHPAPLPSPALKYRLLPELRSQTAGDAVPLYNEAVDKHQAAMKEFLQARPDYSFSKWTEMPLKELPCDELRKALEPFKAVLELIDKAARRERCIGEAPAGSAKAGADLKLPESYVLDQIVTLLATRCRLQMAEGDLTGAAHTLKTGLAMAKQIGELPRFYYSQTGFFIAEAMLRQLVDFVQQPKAPNLYWALLDLPQPLIDFRQGVDGEREALHRRFPTVAASAANVNAGSWTDEQIEPAVAILLDYYRPPRISVIEDLRGRRDLTKHLTDHYDEYKKVLLDEGRPKDKVEAMPHVQVALLAAFIRYDRLIDDQMKLCNQPYFKVSDKLERLSKSASDAGRDRPLQPIVPIDVVPLRRAQVVFERKISALRCVEALRACAATHDGKLPAALDGVKEAPVPLDPVTGKAFIYKAAAGKATLEAPEVSGDAHRNFDELAYEITIKRP
jgi:hypothetical protein